MLPQSGHIAHLTALNSEMVEVLTLFMAAYNCPGLQAMLAHIVENETYWKAKRALEAVKKHEDEIHSTDLRGA